MPLQMRYHLIVSGVSRMKFAVFLCILVIGCNGSSVSRQERRFPDDFLFGTATASYQVEGGWDADGKGESIWDHLMHTSPEIVKDLTNGDVAADSYHNYKRDVEMLRELGLDIYRFSVSWSRILPDGRNHYVNEAGVQFYNNYIDEMIKYNITPMITLYHFDLPQKLQELGGFQNPLISDWFEDYARVVFEKFGDRVKHWITFNEPNQICYAGYGGGFKAPRVNATDIGTYLCAKHLVLAHAKAYHAYNNDFKPSQGGVCGITICVNGHDPPTESKEDEYAAEIYRQAEWGLYAEPIFSEEGGFPKEFAARVAEKSAQQGYPKSRLPEFSESERALALGASDFFGVNHYTAVLVSATGYAAQDPVPSLYDDIGFDYHTPDDWLEGSSYWLKLAPNSIYNALSDLRRRYKNPVVYITENGWSQSQSGFEDDDRITYYRAAWESLLDCLDDGINLKGYVAWSLMDNFEWQEGYTERFGLYEVDFEDPSRARTPRKSAFVYKQLIKTRVVDHSYEPQDRVMTIDEGH